MSHRIERVNDLLRGALADIMRLELRDPRVRLASIAGISVSRDLGYAEIRVSVLGSDEEREEAIQALVRARGFLRSQLARRVRLRTVPELRFHLDRGAEHSQHISDLLESLNGSDEPT